LTAHGFGVAAAVSVTRAAVLVRIEAEIGEP